MLEVVLQDLLKWLCPWVVHAFHASCKAERLAWKARQIDVNVTRDRLAIPRQDVLVEQGWLDALIDELPGNGKLDCVEKQY